MARNKEINVKINADTKDAKTAFKELSKSLKKTRDDTKNTKNSFGQLTKSMIASGGVLFGLNSLKNGLMGLGRSFWKASTTAQDLQTEFKTLLGSAKLAKDRFKELTDFAAKTPFQLEQVAKASKILETFTKGALSTGESLRMVGDAAAITGEKDFAGLAMWVGRAYDGLQNNRPVGEAMMRLQELALVSGEARGKIEELQQAGKGKEAWIVLEGELKKASGGMDALSKNASGVASTIKDQLNLAMVQFAEAGVIDTITDGMKSFSNVLQGMLDANVFSEIARGFALLQKLYSGNLDLSQERITQLAIEANKTKDITILTDELSKAEKNLTDNIIKLNKAQNASDDVFDVQAVESYRKAITESREDIKLLQNLIKDFDTIKKSDPAAAKKSDPAAAKKAISAITDAEREAWKKRQEEGAKWAEKARQLEQEKIIKAQQAKQDALDLANEVEIAKQEAYWNNKAEIRRMAQKKEEEDLKRSLEMRQNINSSIVSGATGLTNILLSELNRQQRGRAKSEAEQKKAARRSVLINAAKAHGGAAASIWTGSGSWQEKLAESIAVSAQLFAMQAIQLSTIKKAARGANYRTNGPELLMVGDNPGGREDVSVTPVGSANQNGPRGGGSGMSVSMPIIIQGNADQSTVRSITRERQKQLREFRSIYRELQMHGEL